MNFKNNNCEITTEDRIVLHLRDEKECAELFGLDDIKEFVVYIPEDLIKEYQENRRIFFEIQDKLRTYYKKG